MKNLRLIKKFVPDPIFGWRGIKTLYRCLKIFDWIIPLWAYKDKRYYDFIYNKNDKRLK